MRLGPYWEPDGAAGTVDAAPATPTPESATPPRDEKGRFTAAKIEALASQSGLPDAPAQPASAPTAAAPVAATPAEPPKVETPATPDADLAALDAFAASQPAPATPAQQPAAPSAPVASTPELQQVQYWMSDPQIAAEAVSAARAHVILNNALNRGDFDGAFAQFTPQVQESLAEHLYQRNKAAWAQRFSDEANGVQQDPRLTMALRQIQELQNTYQTRERMAQEQQDAARQAQQRQAAQVAFTNYLDKMFESVNLKDSPNRKYLQGALMQEISKDQRALANIREGRYGDLVSKFKGIYQEFRPLLQPAVQATTTPAASHQLMASPSGAASSPAPDAQTSLVGEGGRINGRGLVARLKQFTKVS